MSTFELETGHEFDVLCEGLLSPTWICYILYYKQKSVANLKQYFV